MKVKLFLWFLALMLLTSCGNDKALSELSDKIDKANEEIETLKAENKKLKDTAPENETVSTQPRANIRKKASVTRIIDGDTIEVMFEDGKVETVRLLLVDTPETKDPNEPIQPYGPEATEFAEKTLQGKEVTIELDGPERDKYDRLLAYIWIDSKIFNELLIKEGLARVAYVYDPPYNHYKQLLAAEDTAKAERIGIWSINGYVTADGFQFESVETVESETPEVDEPPRQEVFYKNCTAVRAAGAAPLYEGDPGYSTKLDRDRDGVACE